MPQAGALAVPGGAVSPTTSCSSESGCGARVAARLRGRRRRTGRASGRRTRSSGSSRRSPTACVGAALVPLNTRWQLGEVLALVGVPGAACGSPRTTFLGKSLSRSASGAWPGPVIALPSWDGLLERDRPPAGCRARRAAGRADARRRQPRPVHVGHDRAAQGRAAPSRRHGLDDRVVGRDRRARRHRPLSGRQPDGAHRRPQDGHARRPHGRRDVVARCPASTRTSCWTSSPRSR